MQSTATPSVTSTFTTTSAQNTTKSYGQILMQSSGAMIAVIVIGIIIILTILLIILKTYNRITQASRMLGRGSKARQKLSTVHTSVPMTNMGANSVSSGFTLPLGNTTNGLQLPRVDRSGLDHSSLEQISTNSTSTVVTIHDTPSLENT